MQLRHVVADFGLKSMNRTHQAVLRLSGGRVLSRPFGIPAIKLHTTGRKTGRDRVTMLIAPIADAQRVVLVASKGGDDRDPDWFCNLVEHPDVVVVMDGVLRAMRARMATEEERAALWPRVVDAYRGYASYQRRTARQIPLVICELRPATG
ncbi:MAG: nitroreductase/quinone reductase family protein [Acidimicrobiales bacterium]